MGIEQPPALDVYVVDKATVAREIVKISLRRVDGTLFPLWEAGAHVELLLPDGVRHYSICSSPENREQLDIAVLRAVPSQGGSEYVHGNLHVGSKIQIREPRNNFYFASSPRYQFIAGGVGITAILPMLEKAELDGSEWNLVYVGKQLSNMAFVDELVSRYGDRVEIHPSAALGRLDLTRILGMPRAKMLVYACGPETLLKDVEDYCRGWPPGVLHSERFTALATTTGAGAGPFEVELTESQLTLEIPSGKSILDIAEDAGVRILSSCRQGVCGTCETKVIDGEVDHRDVVLSSLDKEVSETMMVCVSRAGAGCNKLVLDL